MRADLRLKRDERTGKLRLEVRGNKVLLVIGLLVPTVLGLIAGTMVWRAAISYGAYEGVVLDIEYDWFSSWFDADESSSSRLTIQMPEGKRVTRFVDDYALALSGIRQGDYVQKEKGFFQNPQARDRKTASELLEELREGNPSPGGE